jgi:hypothetical protein
MIQGGAILGMVERHLVAGERHIERQREIIARLRSRGLKTDQTEYLLKLFEQVQETHATHKRLLLRTAELLRKKRAGARAPVRIGSLRRLALASGSLAVSIIESYGEWHVMVCDGERAPTVRTFDDEDEAVAYAEERRMVLGLDKVARF